MFRVAVGSECTAEKEKTFFKGKSDQEELIFLNLIRHWNQGQDLDLVFLNMSTMQLPI